MLQIPLNDKENVPPNQLQRQQTTETIAQKMKIKREWKSKASEGGMMIRSCDGSQAAFYVLKDKNMKIGRG